jgi:hypothetical protein
MESISEMLQLVGEELTISTSIARLNNSNLSLREFSTSSLVFYATDSFLHQQEISTITLNNSHVENFEFAGIFDRCISYTQNSFASNLPDQEISITNTCILSLSQFPQPETSNPPNKRRTPKKKAKIFLLHKQHFSPHTTKSINLPPLNSTTKGNSLNFSST